MRGPWYRAHHPSDGPWYFASATTRAPDGGRFDLPDPDGTCYMASDVDSAVRERLGHVAAAKPLTAAAVAATSITVVKLTTAQRKKVADTTAPAAAVIITREIGVMPQYRRTRPWAQHWRATGHTGILYQPRFSTGPVRALALFGPAGPDDDGPTVGPAVPAAETLHLTGVSAIAGKHAVIVDDD